MKKWLIFSALCIACGLIALCSQGCSSAKPGSLADIHRQAAASATKAYQECLMRYRKAQWPNVIIYNEHPCKSCMRGNPEACSP